MRFDTAVRIHLTVATLVLAVLAAACGPLASFPAASTASASASHPAWIIAGNSITQLEKAGASRKLIDDAFNNDRTYALYLPSEKPAGIGVPTASFSSYAALQKAFQVHTMPGPFKAVLYDNEKWTATPTNEQKDPDHFEQLFASLAHQHGLKDVSSPAPDLMWATGRPPHGSYQTYLDRDIPGHAAHVADVFDIQGQIRETDVTFYKGFVKSAAQEARQGNSHVLVMIGIRTNPGTAAIEAAYNAVNGLGDGYWLNVNGRPGPALDLLHRIYGNE